MDDTYLLPGALRHLSFRPNLSWFWRQIRELEASKSFRDYIGFVNFILCRFHFFIYLYPPRPPPHPSLTEDQLEDQAEDSIFALQLKKLYREITNLENLEKKETEETNE